MPRRPCVRITGGALRGDLPEDDHSGRAAIDAAVGTEQPGEDPRDNVAFIVDEDVCTRCALCVDRCPTGVIILGKLSPAVAEGDSHVRTQRHGYAYGVRF